MKSKLFLRSSVCLFYKYPNFFHFHVPFGVKTQKIFSYFSDQDIFQFIQMYYILNHLNKKITKKF